jgi:Uma2 family endonuclease
MAAIPLRHEPEIEYPESDGKPMAESDVHLDAMVGVIQGLKDHFAGDPDIYVAGNLLLYYYEEGKRSSVAPDAFVVRGVPKRKRGTYLLWREGKAPCFVLEVTSKTTRNEDLATKKALYAKLGVEEYFLFDPLGEYLRPRFQALRLAGREYRPMALADDGSLVSQTLGIAFRPEGESLGMTDMATGERVLSHEELNETLQATAERAAAAEARARELAEELERLRGRVPL